MHNITFSAFNPSMIIGNHPATLMLLSESIIQADDSKRAGMVIILLVIRLTVDINIAAGKGFSRSIGKVSSREPQVLAQRFRKMSRDLSSSVNISRKLMQLKEVAKERHKLQKKGIVPVVSTVSKSVISTSDGCPDIENSSDLNQEQIAALDGNDSSIYSILLYLVNLFVSLR